MKIKYKIIRINILKMKTENDFLNWNKQKYFINNINISRKIWKIHKIDLLAFLTISNKHIDLYLWVVRSK